MTAMMYRAVLQATGILQALAGRILHAVRSAGGLIVATLATAFGVNVLASDQYISIVLPGRMFRSEYQRRRLDPKKPVASYRWRTLRASITSVHDPLEHVAAHWERFTMMVDRTFQVADLSDNRNPAPPARPCRRIKIKLLEVLWHVPWH